MGVSTSVLFCFGKLVASTQIYTILVLQDGDESGRVGGYGGYEGVK